MKVEVSYLTLAIHSAELFSKGKMVISGLCHLSSLVKILR